MRTFDASSVILGWDQYPIAQFPKLWEWVGEQIAAGEITVPAVAYEQIEHIAPACHEWLEEQGCTVLEATDDILQAAVAIKNDLGIVNDNYHPDGVDEADVIIVATAKVHQVRLVSDESPQPTPPPANNVRRLKIPRVCRRPDVAVECGNFLDYLKESGERFG